MSRSQQLLTPNRTILSGYADEIFDIAPSNLLTYWTLHNNAKDISGNGRHGSDVGSPSYGHEGIGDGLTSVLLDGANDGINIYSDSLRDAFTPDEFTIVAWAKVSGVGVWTDGVQREIIRLLTDSNNFALMDKSTTSDLLSFQRRAQSTTDSASQASTNTDWFHVAVTASISGDAFKAFYNGVQAGVTGTGLLAWAGLIGSTTSMIGAANTAAALAWSGYIAHVAIWNTALTDGQIEDLASR